MSSTFRSAIEEASLPLLARISRVHRIVPFLVVLCLVIAGSLIPGWGWVLLALVAALMAWLLFLSWPRLQGTERLMRVAVLVFIVGITVVKAFPHR